MKIKRKVQKTLPQLIEWAWDNRATENTYKSESITVTFSISGNPRIESKHTFLPKNETFTVTTEEEIDEDTELDLVLRFIAEDKAYYTNPQTMSINTCLEAERDDVTKTHFYIENDNRELVLIWRDGKLVE